MRGSGVGLYAYMACLSLFLVFCFNLVPLLPVCNVLATSDRMIVCRSGEPLLGSYKGVELPSLCLSNQDYVSKSYLVHLYFEKTAGYKNVSAGWHTVVVSEPHRVRCSEGHCG